MGLGALTGAVTLVQSGTGEEIGFCGSEAGLVTQEKSEQQFNICFSYTQVNGETFYSRFTADENVNIFICNN